MDAFVNRLHVNSLRLNRAFVTPDVRTEQQHELCLGIFRQKSARFDKRVVLLSLFRKRDGEEHQRRVKMQVGRGERVQFVQ